MSTGDRHLDQQSQSHHVETQGETSTRPLLEAGSQQQQPALGETSTSRHNANDDSDYIEDVDDPPVNVHHRNSVASRRSKRSSLSVFGGAEGPGPGGRHFSFSEENETRIDLPEEPPENNGRGGGREREEKQKPISWSQLPRKDQLFILVLARLSEPLTQTSLQSYLFYQLKSFNPSLPDSTISSQAGIFQGSFTAAQFFTSVWWGRLADSPRVGRKRVLLIGLCGTMISCLGFGFSKSFTSAIIFRILGGLMNSNVGVLRTMISEIIVEKKYQSRAFLLLPMCFNVGVIIGPSLGGFLADPVNGFPGLFGPGSLIGGKDGVWWMRYWPYALPNLVSAIFILTSWLSVFFVLEETHEALRYDYDWGISIGKAIARKFRRHSGHRYHRIDEDDTRSVDLLEDEEESPAGMRQRHAPPPARTESPWKQLLTKNVILTLITHSLLAMHTSAFNSMAFVFLPTPRAPEGNRRGFFHFNGGLGLTTQQVGLATSIIGLIGLPMQLLVYPRVQFRLGVLKSFRTFLPMSPVAYALMPFLVLIPAAATGLIWASFTFVVLLQVISRTFANPAAIILVNNSVSDPHVLGTIHGIAQCISSGARTLGPFLGGLGLSLGLEHNIIGAVWWALALEAALGWLVSWSIYEGEGIQRVKPPPRETIQEEEEEGDEGEGLLQNSGGEVARR